VAFEPHGDWVAWRPKAEVDVSEGIRLLTHGVTVARQHGVTRLLLDLRRLSGPAAPGVSQRFWLARSLAEASAWEVRLAVLAPRRLIDPDRIGVIAARNAGLDVGLFTREAEAVTWLTREAPPVP
jgi:hypothetical protein